MTAPTTVRRLKEQLDGKGSFKKIPSDEEEAEGADGAEGGGIMAAGDHGDDVEGGSAPLVERPGEAWSSSDRPRVRYYERWPGKNRFCCWGRVMLGPWDDWPFNGCAWTTIAIPSYLYFRYAAPVLWEHWGPGYPIFCAYALASTVVSLSLTTCTDPGYIRREPQQGPREDEQAPPRKNMYGRAAAQTAQFATALGGGRSTFTWCTTCLVWRPPRSHHCSDCGACVLGYDHHCPFVNNCVGVRNHVYFLSFLGSVVWLGSTVMLGTMMAMDPAFRDPSQRPHRVNGRVVPPPPPPPETAEDAAAHGKASLLAMMMVPVSIITVVLVIFLSFHVYLSCTGRTTKALVKSMKAKRAGGGGGGGGDGGGGASASGGAAAEGLSGDGARQRSSAAAAADVEAGEGDDADAGESGGGSAGGGGSSGGGGGVEYDYSGYSGVVGYEVSKGSTTRLCMPALIDPLEWITDEEQAHLEQQQQQRQ